MTKLTPQNVEDKYVLSAIQHLQLLEEGDRRGSNSAHDRLIAAIKKIRVGVDQGQHFLTQLLTHPDENVRLWSASHLLPLDEKQALTTLKKLVHNASSSIVRSTADVTLAEWRKGTLDIDWFMKE